MTDAWEVRTGQALLAIALGGLGLIALATPGPLGGWMPLPDWLPAEAAIGRLMGMALVVAGAALIALPDVSRVLIAVAIILASWIVILHPTGLVAAGFSAAAWLGVAEVGAVAAACWMFGALLSGRLWTGTPQGRRTALLATAIYGVALLVFGLCHFVYLDFTAAMVPDWMPARRGLAAATGVAHVAAGLALLSGVQDRLAMRLQTAMCGSFVLLVHVPRVGADPGNRSEWLLLCTSLLLIASAWIMAVALARRPDAFPAGLRAQRSGKAA